MTYSPVDTEDKYWWKSESNVAKKVFSVAAHIFNNQRQSRLQDNILAMKQYSGTSDIGDSGEYGEDRFSFGSFFFGNDVDDNTEPYSDMNIVRSIVDTMHSSIAKDPSRARLVPKDGDYSAHKQAKTCEQFIHSTMYSADAKKKMSRCYLNSLVTDIGVLYFAIDHDEIIIENVFANEIFVDLLDGINGSPNNMFRIRVVQPEKLIDMYPDKEEMIRQSAEMQPLFRDLPDRSSSYRSTTDIVEVVQVWRKSLSKESPGRFVTCTQCGLLEDEEWPYDYHPFIIMRWSERIRGFYGQPLSEQVMPAQARINRMLSSFVSSAELYGNPWIMVEESSDVNVEQIANIPGTAIKYHNTPPEVYAPDGIAPSMFQLFLWNIQNAYEEVGVSQMRAQSKRPSGDVSGKALIHLDNKESERFSTKIKDLEDYWMFGSKIVMDLGQELVNQKGSIEIFTSEKGKSIRSTIKKAMLNKNDYMWEFYPTSTFPSDFPGRIQAILDLNELGHFDPAELAAYLDMPDTEAAVANATADVTLIDYDIEKMTNKDNPQPRKPDPVVKSDLAYKRVRIAYVRGVEAGAPELNLQLMRDYMDEVRTYITAAKQAEIEQQMQLQQMAQPQPQLAPPVAEIAQ